MNSADNQVLLNRFPIKRLSEKDRTVQVYTYSFHAPPEPGQEYTAVNTILWNIWTPGAPLDTAIVTKEKISAERLRGENWTLQPQNSKVLNPAEAREREALERLERRWLQRNLNQKSDKNRVERFGAGGFIWWNTNRIILQDRGWEVHSGVQLDVSVHHSGALFLEIDTHHRFYTPWTLSQWFDTYPEIPISWVRNTYDDQTWKFVRTSDEDPEDLLIAGTSLADYHRNHKKYQATEAEIRSSRVVYVQTKQRELAHLSSRLKPSVTMEILGDLANRGQKEAAKVFKQLRKSVQERFAQAQQVSQWLAENVYQQNRQVKPQTTQGVFLRQKSPILLAKSTKVFRTEACFKHGCLKTGEKQFGCLDLVGNGVWAETVRNKLEQVAKSSGTEVFLETPKKGADLPDRTFTRRQFWEEWADQGIYTVLVISPWLEIAQKTQLRGEALEANVALQFMQPMPKPDPYRAINIVLGVLVKAKWQPIGLEPLQDEQAAEIVIGFDAGTNQSLYYGTSAFAILANGQSLGWELPEAQIGERLSELAVLRTIANLIGRFQRLENRLPRRILLLRDGFVQRNEFEYAIAQLQQEGIAVDLLEVRKSGTGRMALRQSSGQLIDASPGTAVISNDSNTFRIVTSQAKAGGSARPLQIVRNTGDAPLELLAKQIDRLSMLHPASGLIPSRLPMVLHYADKMAKEVQRLGQTGILQGVDREKIFFA